MTWLLVVASALLAGVAAAGILWPFSRPSRVSIEPTADPLEDERLALLRSLRDLERDRAEGSIAEEDYRALRGDTEARAVAVLRALEARDGAGDLAEGMRELRDLRRSGDGSRSGDGNGSGRTTGRRGFGPSLLVAGAVVAVVVPVLAGAVRGRTSGAPFSGEDVAGSTGGGALAFFEGRVEDHPDDLAARLDLAQRYMQSGNLDGAIEQYEAALRISPDNPEAHANLGFLLFLGGRPEQALEQQERALAEDPAYPEALYFKGLILLRGLDRPEGASAAFRDYLEVAPFGSHRSEVRSLLEQAEAAS